MTVAENWSHVRIERDLTKLELFAQRRFIHDIHMQSERWVDNAEVSTFRFRYF